MADTGVGQGANDAACRRYGLSREELVGLQLMQALPAHAAVGLVALCNRALDSDRSVVLCHLHNLGKIHEEQGAESADKLIQILEERLHQILPKNIILARVKVDQLLVVLWDRNNRAQAEAMAESIRGVMAPPVRNQGALIRMATSVTVALEQPGSCMEDLISSAMEEWSDPSWRCSAVSR